MSTKVSHEGILLLEQPFVRVPYENLRKNFRATQKHVERDFGALQTASKKVDKNDTGETAKAIDGLIARVESLKRKLSDLNESSSIPVDAVMRGRLKHIAEVEEMDNTEDIRYAQWTDTRLDRWLVDWSLRNGKFSTARKIAEEKGLAELVDIAFFEEIHRIEEGLWRGSCTEALAWCSDNKSALRKLKSTLEFDLRLQEYIELARTGKAKEAIAYLQKHLLPWQETHLAQITQASALIIYPANTTCPRFKRLYDLSRWKTLQSSFRLAVYTLTTLPAEPLLHIALSAGLPALKVPACYDPSCQNVDCPICDKEGLGQLAKEVPWSHHFNSTIVCRISGKIMDANNPPLAFPNGYMYSMLALREMADRSPDQFVRCPWSGMECKFDELRKVFVS